MNDIRWDFAIGDKVYDKGANANGIVVGRKLEEDIESSLIYYSVCYKREDSSWVYEWTSGNWLNLGHKTIID